MSHALKNNISWYITFVGMVIDFIWIIYVILLCRQIYISCDIGYLLSIYINNLIISNNKLKLLQD